MGFETPSDEAFYGFGERFNALDQRGNHLDNYVYGQYLNQEKRSYIPIPFFLSSRVYGFWVETEQQVQFDLAADKSNSWFLIGNVGEDQSLNIRFFFQKNPHSIVKTFTDKTGKPQLPPPWVYGLWMSSNDWNNQTDVLRQLDLSKRYEIPASVMVVEAWSDEINFYIWNDAQFKHKPSSQAYSYSDFVNPKNGKWPDPKSMIDELHRSGMRLVLWQIPVMKFGNPDENLDETQKDADQEFAIKQKFIVNNTDGDPYRIEAHAPWFGNSLLFDFTNPEAEQWWFDKREYLITEMGVDGFKTDGGEHSWDAKTRFSNGLRGDRGINTYPMMYEEAYNRFLKKHRGNDYVLFSRAGYTGVQQISCHWAGDERSTWNAFRSTINAMLNVSMCGVSFIGWDIAGFAGPIPETDLYLRAVAFSVFCPIMQYHSDYNARRPPCKDRTPWNIQEQSGDQRIIPLFKRFTNLRMNLIPYILSQAQMSSMSGLPLMRALPLEYPEDINCRSHPSEYLFGDALLVSPIIEPKKTECQVYLPQGKWCDLWTGMIFEGAQEISVHAPMDTIPVFQRKGSIVLLNLNETLELCGPVGNSTEEFMNLAALVYPGKFYEIEIYQGAGRTPGRISTQLDPNDGVRVNVNNIQNGIDLFILGIEPSLVTFNGKLIPCLEQDDVFSDSHWKKRRNRSEIHVHIPKGQEVFTLFLQ
jgi:alpha-glucosidase (family GH31 glycosyl hydrolase)